MCGRYYIPPEDDDAGFQALLEHLGSAYHASPLLAQMKRGEILPTDIAPVVTADNIILMAWGFPRFDGKGVLINARLETAAEKPMFKKAYGSQRCLVPAAHYFEWRKDGVKKQKFALGTGDIIYMAGLYRFEQGQPLPSFVILTRPAAHDISFIHDRMPIILPEPFQKHWLSDPMDAAALLEASGENISYKAVI
ncbi:SOS response-associated peptidase [Oscillospiraceae bacterium WX1]